MRPLRWGILGTGKIAGLVTNAMRQVPQWAVPVAVASRSRERAKAFAATHGDLVAVVGAAELVLRPEVDAIYIATPPSEHLSDALIALQAAKPVLCEKPLTTSARDTEDLASAAREGGVFLMEALWTRFLPSMAALRDVIASGRIGTPVLLDAELGMVLDAAPDHYLWDPERGGGVLLDVGPYAVSLSTMLLGTPGTVTGLAIEGSTGVDLAAAGAVRFGANAMATFRLSFRADIPPVGRVFGTEGFIALEPPLFHPPALVVIDQNGRAERLDPHCDLPGWAYQLREVTESVAAGRGESPVMPLSESVVCARVLDAVRGSAG